jgi:hypothetical protein
LRHHICRPGGTLHDRRQLIRAYPVVGVEHPEQPEQLALGPQRHAPARPHVELGHARHPNGFNGVREVERLDHASDRRIHPPVEDGAQADNEG